MSNVRAALGAVMAVIRDAWQWHDNVDNFRAKLYMPTRVDPVN